MLALGEATALVVGVGAVGAEVGRLLAAFGTRVVGVDARAGRAAAGVRRDPPGRHARRAPARRRHRDRHGAAHPADRGPVRRRRLARCTPTALFVNVGRGPTVDLDALAAALAQGRLGAAALDVFEPEPLPADHPLWNRPDVLLTPHVAGVGPHADERRFAVLLENARRFVAGRDLVNVVDKASWF